MHTALVTGASGLLGVHVVRALLATGTRVRALVRRPDSLAFVSSSSSEGAGACDVRVGDLRDLGVVRAAVYGVDVVFHAAHSHEYWRPNREVYDANVGGMRNLLVALADRPGCRLVFSGSANSGHLVESSAETDALAACPPGAEAIPRRRFNSLTKVWAELLGRIAAAERGLDVRVVRVPYLIGPLDLNPTPLRLVIPVARVFPVLVSPPCGCSITGAAEAARAHVQAAADGGQTRVHVVQGHDVLLPDYVAMVNRVIRGRSYRPQTLPAWAVRLCARGQVFDASAASRLLSCEYAQRGESDETQPRIPLEDTVRLTVGWFANHPTLRTRAGLMRYARRYF